MQPYNGGYQYAQYAAAPYSNNNSNNNNNNSSSSNSKYITAIIVFLIVLCVAVLAYLLLSNTSSSGNNGGTTSRSTTIPPPALLISALYVADNSTRSTQLNLTWPAAAGYTNYQVTWDTSITLNSNNVKNQIVQVATELMISGLTANIQYYFQVEVLDTAGNVVSNAAATCSQATYDSLTVFTCTNIYSTELQFSWSTYTDAIDYVLFACTDPNNVVATLLYGQNLSTTTGQLVNLTASTTYYVFVYADTANGRAACASLTQATNSIPAPTSS